MSFIRLNQYYIFISLLLFLLCSIRAGAQQRNTQEEYNVDSVLYDYYIRCKAEVSSPASIQMADTLFRMADEKKDQRMQAVALCNKLDYYYFKNEKDSILRHVDIVKTFSQKTNQSKYYYFVWGKRLINYYIKHHQYNIALYEAQNMMDEAEEKADPLGLSSAYSVLSSIYQLKKMSKLSAENLEKSIEINLQYNIDKFNLSSSYFTLAAIYIRMEQYDKAQKYLEKGKELFYTPVQEYSYYTNSARYYLALGDNTKALKDLQQARLVADNHKEVRNQMSEYYNVLVVYYSSVRQFDKALAAQDSLSSIFRKKNEFNPNTSLVLANLYSQLGKYENATGYYQMYISETDSLNSINEDIATSEFAAMLGVERLNREKSELQQQMQQRELTSKKYIIIFLIMLLTIGLIMFYREHLLNSRLRFSQKQLSDKNRELIDSQCELKIAKDRAEGASHMKTEFIQSMSHEIRTPLNSIVGFSQILSSYFSSDDETREFATIIEQGSTNLLKLVNDVLDLSNLDTEENIPVHTVADITALCQTCIDQTQPRIKPGVQLHFVPERENLYTLTNPDRLIQILINLLQNASKFTTEGEIRLSYHTNEERRHIQFSVMDTGVGIPPEKREYVFERFSKIDSFVHGTGLGLSISRLIAEKMGGSLIIDPDYSSGCRFVLTLPTIDK